MTPQSDIVDSASGIVNRTRKGLVGRRTAAAKHVDVSKLSAGKTAATQKLDYSGERFFPSNFCISSDKHSR